MVYEGEGYGGVGHLGAVCHLADVEIVAYEQRLLHRRGWDDIHLEYEQVYERGYDRSEDYSADPLVDGAVCGALLAQTGILAPDVTVEETRDVEVVYYGHAEQKPQIACPHHEPKDVKYGSERESHPFVAEEFSDLSHIGLMFLYSLSQSRRGRKITRRT